MRLHLLFPLFAVVITLAPAARADQFETFYIDPARSFLEFQFGDFASQVNASTFLFAPLELQPGSDPAPIDGEFVLRIGNDASAPTFFSIVSGTADVRPLDVNTVSPGPGGSDGTTDAALGLSFLDSSLGVSGDIAAHDLIFSLEGFFDPVANPLGPFGLQGDLGWTLAAGAFEISTSAGASGTAFAPNSGGPGFVDRNMSQFSEISPGIYEVVAPFGFTVFTNPTDSGPFSQTSVAMDFRGEIVATNVIPEPGTGWLLAAGLALLGAQRSEARGR